MTNRMETLKEELEVQTPLALVPVQHGRHTYPGCGCTFFFKEVHDT